jgi:hypothetical protein
VNIFLSLPSLIQDVIQLSWQFYVAFWFGGLTGVLLWIADMSPYAVAIRRFM